MQLQLKIIGCILIALAGIHVGFPKRFNWRSELSALSLINRQVMYVHTFFLSLTIFLVGLLCVVSSADLINTKLGHQICFGLSLFWGLRLYFQFFVYSPQLWKGKPFETRVHLVFSVLWTYLAIMFFFIGMR
jgi:hypothetical protein